MTDRSRARCDLGFPARASSSLVDQPSNPTTLSGPATPDPVELVGGEHLVQLLVNLERTSRDHPDAELTAKIAQLVAQGRDASRMQASERRSFEVELRRFCFLNNLPQVLALSGVPAIYNFREPYERNVIGPWDRFPESDGVTRGRRWSLLGESIGYPIGVPASVLTANARYVEYYARQGFNVITYKTVRSQAREEQPFPNWVYLRDLDRPLTAEEADSDNPVVGDREAFFDDPAAISTANSFGVPSPAPDEWQVDVADALARIGDGKLLIVSVMGSSEIHSERDALVQDFVTVAHMAAETEASAIELNLSCPNTYDPQAGAVERPICAYPEDTRRIVSAVREQMPHVKLVAKLGYLPKAQLERTVSLIAGEVDAISGINTLQRTVVTRAGRPTFLGTVEDANGFRDRAGVSGVAIRALGMDFTQSLSELKQQHGWTFETIGMGGVMTSADVRSLLDAGAAAVQTATAAAHNPMLPTELTEPREGQLSGAAVQLLAFVERRPGADAARIASAARMSISAVQSGLVELQSRGLVAPVDSETGRTGYLVDENELEKQLSLG